MKPRTKAYLFAGMACVVFVVGSFVSRWKHEPAPRVPVKAKDSETKSIGTQPSEKLKGGDQSKSLGPISAETVVRDPYPASAKFVIPGLIKETGVFSTLHGVGNDIPQIQLLFFAKKSGKVVPARWKSFTIALVDGPARDFDVGGAYGISYPEGERRVGSLGVRFAIVEDDAKGYWEGANLLRYSRTYEIRFLDRGIKGKCRIRMPKRLEKGQVATYRLRVDKLIESKPPEGRFLTIKGKIVSAFPKGWPANRWRTIYFDPATQKSSESSVANDGTFSVQVSRLGGALRVWPQTGWGVAWFQIQHLKKANVNFPKDADFVSDPLKIRTVKVRIPKDNLLDFEKCVKKYAVFGLHHAAGEDVPVAIGKLFPDEWDKAVQAGIVEIPAVPGKYSLSGSFADGPHLLPMGQIVVPEKPAGVLEATP